ncbi:hypothetical protein DPEC_G00288590 [Dallia pectoralis]|uniref:Uncharacterized protein n=1 Tax=Dallia pectoralis TaxID=75939 RepID=A0ACC2FKI8_DALPE|nr:hypothetical protein DPEC_G00288590 [Dallia pectoralis]
MVDLYCNKDYVFLGLLVVILLGSSILVNVFSLLWYLEKEGTETRKERYLKNLSSLKILHVFQMGVPLRYASVLRISICGSGCNEIYTKDEVRYLKHDLRILRLIETYSESVPQLVLMLTIIIQREEVDLIPHLKAVVSVVAISVSVTMYHRSMQSFHRDKTKPCGGSSVLYFLWNLLLIGSRVMVIVLFTSVFPHYITAHILCSWAVLYFVAWKCKTKFKESIDKVWLYRATIALIWYFNWLNVMKSNSRWIRAIYHSLIVLDNVILGGFWVWQMKKSPPHFDLPLDPYEILGVIISAYFTGLCLMIIFQYCHQQTETVDRPKGTAKVKMLHTDCHHLRIEEDSADQATQVSMVNKRMKILADSFYS